MCVLSCYLCGWTWSIRDPPANLSLGAKLLSRAQGLWIRQYTLRWFPTSLFYRTGEYIEFSEGSVSPKLLFINLLDINEAFEVCAPCACILISPFPFSCMRTYLLVTFTYSIACAAFWGFLAKSLRLWYLLLRIICQDSISGLLLGCIF